MANLCCALVIQSCLTLCDPMDCSLPDSSVHGDSPGKNTGVGCHTLLQGYGKSRQCIKKLRHHFTDKGLSTQMHGFSSSHVWMRKLDHKEGWLKRGVWKTGVIVAWTIKGWSYNSGAGEDHGGAHLSERSRMPLWTCKCESIRDLSRDAKKLLAKSLKLRKTLWTWTTGLEFFLRVKMVFKASSLEEGLSRWS